MIVFSRGSAMILVLPMMTAFGMMSFSGVSRPSVISEAAAGSSAAVGVERVGCRWWYCWWAGVLVAVGRWPAVSPLGFLARLGDGLDDHAEDIGGVDDT